MKFNEGDIYRWHFRSGKAGDFMPYHCCSCIAIVYENVLYDTFWIHLSYPSYGSDVGKRWTNESAIKNLDLEYIGNINDLIKVDSYNEKYYNERDIVNLNHSNSTSGNFFIRKGAVKCKEKILEGLMYQREKALGNIVRANRDIQTIDESIRKVNEGESLDSISVYEV